MIQRERDVFGNSVSPMAQGEDKMMAISEEIFEVGGPILIEGMTKSVNIKESRNLSERSALVRQCLDISSAKPVRLRSVSERSVCRYAATLSRLGTSTRFRDADYELQETR